MSSTTTAAFSTAYGRRAISPLRAQFLTASKPIQSRSPEEEKPKTIPIPIPGKRGMAPNGTKIRRMFRLRMSQTIPAKADPGPAVKQRQRESLHRAGVFYVVRAQEFEWRSRGAVQNKGGGSQLA